MQLSLGGGADLNCRDREILPLLRGGKGRAHLFLLGTRGERRDGPFSEYHGVRALSYAWQVEKGG